MISVVSTAVPARSCTEVIPSPLPSHVRQRLIRFDCATVLRQACNTSLPRPHLPPKRGTIGMQPFKIKHDKSGVHDCCMSGIHHFKKTDYGAIESIWNADNLKLKHSTSVWKNLSGSYRRSWKQKRMSNEKINFVYSAQVWEYQIFTNNSSFPPCPASL